MSAAHEPSNTILDNIRLPDRELLAILNTLSAADRAKHKPNTNGDAPHRNGHSAVRNLPRLLMHICQNESSNCLTYLVKPRDIHSEGVVFLHGAFVHAKAHCAMLLRTRDGRPTQVSAKIMNCRHVSGRIHELVAVFDRPIKIEEFMFADGTTLTGEDG